MVHHESGARTLYDYAADYNWIRQLGWSDDELRSVQVHEQATAGEDAINLANFGGTSLGVRGYDASPTSADARSVRNLWVYQSMTPPELWQRLRQLVDEGGTSA